MIALNKAVLNADIERGTISRHIYGHFAEHLGRHAPTGEAFDLRSGTLDGTTERNLPPGPYRAAVGGIETALTLLPGAAHPVDFGRLAAITLQAEGGCRLRAVVRGAGPAELELRLFGAKAGEPAVRTAELPAAVQIGGGFPAPGRSS